MKKIIIISLIFVIILSSIGYAVLYDDFEGAVIDGALWTRTENGNTGSGITTDQFINGTKSYFLSTQAGKFETETSNSIPASDDVMAIWIRGVSHADANIAFQVPGIFNLFCGSPTSNEWGDGIATSTGINCVDGHFGIESKWVRFVYYNDRSAGTNQHQVRIYNISGDFRALFNKTDATDSTQMAIAGQQSNGDLYMDFAWSWEFAETGWNESTLSIPQFVSPSPSNNTRTKNQTNINITCPPNSGITLWFNESSDLNNSHIKLNNETIDVETSSANYTTGVNINQEYFYKASCDNGTTNSSLRSWFFDDTAPTITLNSNNFYKEDNSTILSKLNPDTNISILFQDNLDLFAYEINITNSTGDTLFFNESTALSGVEFNLSIFVNLSAFDIGNYDSKVSVSDSHTDNLIGDYGTITKDKEILFLTEEDNLIKISSDLTATTSYEKSDDRYSFSFDFGNTLTQQKVFTVECDKKLYYRPNSGYKAHFVCSDGIRGNWLDFEGVSSKPIIEQINDYKYTLTFAQLDNKVTFNSIGGLNVQTLTSNFTITTFFPLNPYIQVGTPDDVFEWNFTGEFNQKLNISLNETLLNNIIDEGCNCTGCSIIGTDCSIPILFHSDAASKLFIKPNITYEFGLDNCGTFPYQVLNLTYFDEKTLTSITATNAYDLLIQNPFSQNIFGTFTGKNSDSFCTNVNVTSRGLTYDIFGDFTLQSSGYSTRIISNNVFNQYQTETNPFFSLPMFLIDTSNLSIVTYTIRDAVTTVALEGVQAKMFRVINGTDVLVESKLSDVVGKVVFDYLTDTRYKFEFSISTYNTGIFDQNPINGDSFEINLFKTDILNNTQDYDRITITWVPNIFRDNVTTNFNFTILSVYDELTNYGYTLTYPGGTDSNTGSNPRGETLSTSFDIVNPSVFDKVKIDYFYDMPITGRRNFTVYYSIQVTPGNLTMAANRDNTYGMGLFERITIATFVVLIVVGISTLVGQPIMGTVIGLFVWGYFSVIGFIPIWAILISILGGIILLSNK